MLDVDRLQAEVGSTVELNDVLLIAGDAGVSVGTPIVDGARVLAEVLEHGRDKKILVFKYKNKTRYRRRHGHRQDYTRLAIRQILTEGEAPAAAEKPKRAARKPVAKAEVIETPAAVAATVEAPVTEAATPATEPAPKAKPARRPRAKKAAEPEAEATQTEE